MYPSLRALYPVVKRQAAKTCKPLLTPPTLQLRPILRRDVPPSSTQERSGLDTHAPATEAHGTAKLEPADGVAEAAKRPAVTDSLKHQSFGPVLQRATPASTAQAAELSEDDVHTSAVAVHEDAKPKTAEAAEAAAETPKVAQTPDPLKYPGVTHPKPLPPVRSHPKVMERLRGFLETSPAPEAVMGYLVRCFHDEQVLSLKSPHNFFESVIALVFEVGYHREALEVYRMMTDDFHFLPAPKTRVRMLSVTLAHFCKTEKEVARALAQVVADPDFTENDFLDLLEMVGELNVPLSQLTLVAEQFVLGRGDQFIVSNILKRKIMKIYAENGDTESALAVAARESKLFRPYHYATVLRVIAETDPNDKVGRDTIFKAMEETGVQPDIHVLNAVISNELERGSLHNAFLIYDTILSFYRDNVTGMTPNPETFRLLFSGTNRLFKPTAFARKYKVSDVKSPRALFRDMLFFHAQVAIARRRPELFRLTRTHIRPALYAFIKNHDYAGAYHALKSYPAFNIPITIDIYDTVVRHIIRRLRFEIRSLRPRGEVRWADYFLGIEDEATLDKMKKLAMDKHEVTKLLRAVSGEDFSLDGTILDQEPFEKKYTMPTAEMVAGVEPVPEDLKLSITPLQRLLRRSIRATIDLIAANDKEGVERETVLTVLAAAKLDIRPKLMDRDTWIKIEAHEHNKLRGRGLR